jgi:hypothetical protein
MTPTFVNCSTEDSVRQWLTTVCCNPELISKDLPRDLASH